MEGQRKEQQKGFRDKREKFSKEIRKINRQEIFAKRRENNKQQHYNEDEDERKKQHIVDQRYAQHIRKFSKTRYFIDTLPQLNKAIYSNDPIEQHYGTIGIRKILSAGDDPPIQPIIDIGLIPRLIQFTQQQQFPQLQLQATWALTNVASGTVQQCESIVDKGTIPIFIKLLKSQHIGIVQQAVWALGNIASDSSSNRDTIIRNGGVQNLIYALSNAREDQIREYCIWALSNLCRGNPLPNYQLIQQAIPFLAKNLVQKQIQDQSVVADCCWALQYNTKSEYKRIQALLDVGFHTVVVDLLNSHDISIILPTVRIVSRMTMGNPQQMDIIMSQKRLIEAVTDLLNNDKKAIRCQACWILSNIAGGRTEFVNQLIRRQDTIGRLLNLFETDSPEVKQQICHFFANLTLEGQQVTIFNLFKQVNIIKFYLMQLSSEDTKLVKEALQDLYTIMKLGQKFLNKNKDNPFTTDMLNFGCSSILQELQLHPQKQVYQNVYKLMTTFFQVQDPLSL